MTVSIVLTVASPLAKAEAMKDDIGLVADAAMTALHERAKKLERIAILMKPGFDRDELLWLAEVMQADADQGRDRIAAIARKTPPGLHSR